MNSIQKLQYISLVSKVTQELENNVGIRDKDLAEYFVSLAQEAPTVQDFKKSLDDDGEFQEQFVQNIYKLIHKMLPKKKTEGQQKQAQQEKKKQEFHTEELDLDDLNGSDSEDEERQKELQKRKKNEHIIKFPGLHIQNTDNKVVEDNKQYNNDDELDFLSEQSRSRSRSLTKKYSKRSRSDSRDRKKKSKKKRSRSRDRKKKHSDKRRSRSQEKYDKEPLQGKVYPGIVKSVQDYGCFVQLQKCRARKEGLVHISDISQERLGNAFEAVQKNQQVYVKVVLVVNNKIKLSMKDVNQKTGDIVEFQRPKFNIEEKLEQQKPIIRNNKQFGNLTGICVDVDDKQNITKKKKQQNSPEKWEEQRLQYWSKLGITEKKVDVDDSLSDEDEVNVELAESEPLFLQGQTTKSGVILSPIKIIKNAEGTMVRSALNAVQFAKDRREVKEQQNRAVAEQVNKEQFSKDWQDPSAQQRNLIGQIKSMQYNQNDKPDYKQEMMFKANKKVNKSLKSMREQKESLPIFEYKKPLIKAIQENRVLIVIGETGSGKTTQMTQYMLEAGFAKKGKKIGCTQPRRVAAQSIAKRVSEEMGVVLGEEVGFTIRFEDCTSNNTLIKYMTDGMLLREALIDPEMSNYSCVMLDEAHERNLSTDILFGILKNVVAKRKDFTLIVTSATLDAEKFSQYFFDCKIFRIPGRTFPVEILYSKDPEEDYLDAALIVVLQIHFNEPAGDILLFLTGQEEIDNACQTLHERMKKIGPEAPELLICPVYAALPSDVQNRIFAPTPEGSRKVVIATNIAEASLTIDGIYYVIDPGFAKVKIFNPKLGMDSLQIAPVSQASARQRAGRAGRTGPGKCYRLYTEQAFKNEMLPTSVPEIQRTNLANTVLLLKAMGINDLLNFDFMDPPPVQTLISSLEQLFTLGALDDDGLLTKVGMKIAEFPLEPPLGKMLLTAVDLECADEICTIIAMLSVQTIFVRPKEKQQQADQKRSKFTHVDGDHLTLLTVYTAWKNNNFSNIWCSENYIDARSMRRAQDIRKQLVGILDRYRLPVNSAGRNYGKIRKAIASGFFFHSAKKDPQEGYKTLTDNHTVYIHPSSALFNRPPEWVIYHELILTSKEYMRNVTAIDPKWLIDVAPNFYQFSSNQSLNSRKKQEKLEPLSTKYGDNNAWRLSRR